MVKYQFDISAVLEEQERQKKIIEAVFPQGSPAGTLAAQSAAWQALENSQATKTMMALENNIAKAVEVAKLAESQVDLVRLNLPEIWLAQDMVEPFLSAFGAASQVEAAMKAANLGFEIPQYIISPQLASAQSVAYEAIEALSAWKESELISGIAQMVEPVTGLMAAMRESQLQQQVRSFAENFLAVAEHAAVSAQNLKVPDGVLTGFRRLSRLQTIRWIGHDTMPMELLDGDGTDEQVVEAIVEYYLKNWVSVRKTLLLRLAEYQIDEETKAAYREALDAVPVGLYRLVVPCLVAGIERLVRIEFPELKFGGVNKLDKLRRMIENMTVEGAAMFHLLVYDCLEEHLYIDVKDDKQMAAIKSNPVPNRHAALHGLLSYNTAASTLNTIFLCDYVFSMIDANKRQQLMN